MCLHWSKTMSRYSTAICMAFIALLVSGAWAAVEAPSFESAQPTFGEMPSDITLQQAAKYLQTAPADHDAGDLAKKLSNPVASLISVPLQNNFDFNGGTSGDAFKYTLNIQPVIPVSISEDWNLIVRVIQPIIYQEAFFPGEGTNWGLGDMHPQLFFSPKAPVRGWILGAGPTFLFPTATDTALGSGKWGIGPTGVALQQSGPWTYGLLANHIWS